MALSQEEIEQFLNAHPKWLRVGDEGNAIQRTIKTGDYVSAMEVAQKIVPLAEAAGHHPDMLISYGKVVITLTTHDAGNEITEKDTALAEQIDVQV